MGLNQILEIMKVYFNSNFYRDHFDVMYLQRKTANKEIQRSLNFTLRIHAWNQNDRDILGQSKGFFLILKFRFEPINILLYLRLISATKTLAQLLHLNSLNYKAKARFCPFLRFTTTKLNCYGVP